MPNWLLIQALLVKLRARGDVWELRALEPCPASEAKILGQAKLFLQNQNQCNWIQLIYSTLGSSIRTL